MGLHVLILTLDDEENLPFALNSIRDLDAPVSVLDLGSTDETLEIARSYGCNFLVANFEETIAPGSLQRLLDDVLDTSRSWLFRLHAFEQPDATLLNSLRKLPAEPNSAHHPGFTVGVEYWFMGRRLRRAKTSRYRSLRIHAGPSVSGDKLSFATALGARRPPKLRGRLLAQPRDSLGKWVRKLDKLAGLAARSGLEVYPDNLKYGGDLLHYPKPPFRLSDHLRPFGNFIRAYGAVIGLIDGVEGFVFHVMHDLWFPLHVVAKATEVERGLLYPSMPY